MYCQSQNKLSKDFVALKIQSKYCYKVMPVLAPEKASVLLLPVTRCLSVYLSAVLFENVYQLTIHTLLLKDHSIISQDKQHQSCVRSKDIN
jgi:hypothetical protein